MKGAFKRLNNAHNIEAYNIRLKENFMVFVN